MQRLAELLSSLQKSLQHLEGQKVQLMEQKMRQQSKIVSTLNSNLQAATSTIDSQRSDLHELLASVSELARQYADIVEGKAPIPDAGTQAKMEAQHRIVVCAWAHAACTRT